ncbi:hypothetical protein Vafri_10865, partial [Volvox africanus]
EISPSSSLKEREPLLANLRRSSGVDIGVQTCFTFDKATQTPSRRMRDRQPILPIAEHSPSMTNSAVELPWVSLPTPVLLLDDKLDAKKTSARVRAFIRDVNLFFGVIPWGRDQRSCCLFLSQALRGNAKVWYDEWSLSQTQLTVESILDNLRIRFAPQILSVEQEARQKLADKSFYMRAGENVPAYHARLEALFQDIPDIHPREKLFWFQQGLSGVLQPKCAADEKGRPFTSYDDLVLHASGEEARILAERRFRSGVRSNAITMQDVVGDDAMEASDGEPPAKRSRSGAPQAAAAAVGAGPSSASRPRKHSKRGGFGGRGYVGAVRVTSRVVVVTAVGVVLTSRPCRLTRSASSLGSITGMVAR